MRQPPIQSRLSRFDTPASAEYAGGSLKVAAGKPAKRQRIMNIVVSWILECLAAVAVIIGCFSVPELLDLPPWTNPVSGIPVLLYLGWRLDGSPYRWGRQFARAGLLCGLLLAAELLAPGRFDLLTNTIVILAVSAADRLFRPKAPETVP